MFRDRVREILDAVDYKLYDLKEKSLIVIDKKRKNKKVLLDYYELPCSELSDKQDRRIECINDEDIKYIGVRYTNIDNDGYTSFLEIKSKKDQFNDYYTCEFEDDGKFNYIMVNKNGCTFREMNNVDGKPMVTELNYNEHEINVSRQLEGNSEGIRLFKDGVIAFYKNGEMLEVDHVDEDINAYFSSVVSTVDSIIEGSMSYLYEVNPALVNLMAIEFPILKKLFEHRSDCYEIDFIDKYLRKHDIFIHDMKIKNVK